MYDRNANINVRVWCEWERLIFFQMYMWDMSVRVSIHVLMHSRVIMSANISVVVSVSVRVSVIILSNFTLSVATWVCRLSRICSWYNCKYNQPGASRPRVSESATAATPAMPLCYGVSFIYEYHPHEHRLFLHVCSLCPNLAFLALSECPFFSPSSSEMVLGGE